MAKIKRKKKEGRFLKNLLIWFLGFLFGIIALIGGVGTTLKFVSIDKLFSLFGGKSEEVLSEELSEKSVLDALFNLSDFTVDDIKPLKSAILDLSKDDTIGLFVEVDEESLGETKLSGIGEIFGGAIKMKDKNSIKLSDVIDESENADLYKIIRDAVHKPDGEITVGDLEGFDIPEIKLSSVLDETGNEKTYSILRSGLSQPDGYVVIVGDLDDFDINKVKLNKVIAKADCEDNKFLSKLVDDETVTLGNMSDKINALQIKDVYSINCFTNDSNLAVSGAGRYNLDQQTGTYTYNASGEYYLKKDCGSWLFLLYSFDSINSDGHAESYVPTNLTVAHLETGVANVSEAVHNATVRQLMDCGLISYNASYDANKLKMTLSNLLI